MTSTKRRPAGPVSRCGSSDRQIDAMLYECVALSRKKGELLEQAERRRLEQRLTLKDAEG
ncbi:MAG: hypothetical protein ACE5JO_13150 [Candidatus Binatia bacterium]